MRDTSAARYAQGLFYLALEKAKIDSWQKQMRLVKKVFKNDISFRSFFMNYQISKEAKKEVLNKAFKDNIDRDVLNFLCLLVDKHRLKEIMMIAKNFNTLCNEEKGVKEGIVYSTYALEDSRIMELEKALSIKLQEKVELENRIDGNLIKGIKVVIDDVVMDDSMRYKIDALKETLLKDVR